MMRIWQVRNIYCKSKQFYEEINQFKISFVLAGLYTTTIEIKMKVYS